MLLNILFISYIANIRTGGVICRKKSSPKNLNTLFEDIIIELEKAANTSKNFYLTNRLELISNNSNSSMVRILTYITSYFKSLWSLSKQYKKEIFPIDQYKKYQSSSLKEKKSLGIGLLRKICSLDKDIENIKFNVKFGRSDITKLKINSRLSEIKTLKSLQRLVFDTIYIDRLIDRYNKTKVKELIEMAEISGEIYLMDEEEFILQ